MTGRGSRSLCHRLNHCLLAEEEITVTGPLEPKFSKVFYRGVKMQRKEIVEVCDREVLPTAPRLFGT
ncbi:MAG: hypothetical protein WA996_22840, partial [Candidatus Promineifilaceae bacterium]